MDIKKLAEQGDLKSQTSMALSYEVGIVTDVNLELALYWWELAAENGDPQAKQKVFELKQQGIKSSQYGRIKAILVEDNEDEMLVYAKALKALPIKLIMTRTAEEATKLIFQNPDIKLLLIDVSLPGKSGIHLVKHVKALKALEDAKFIFLSSNCSKEIVEAGKKVKTR